MIKIEGLKECISYLNNIAHDQLPFAISKAINDTAKGVRDELKREMGNVFDRPTRFTLNSFFIKPATKRHLQAEIGLIDSRHQYMEPQIFGGPRKVKRSEKWLKSHWTPGEGIKLNSYGNVSAGNITQILSAVKAGPDPSQYVTAKSRKRKKNPRRYFLIRNQSGKLRPGIWERGKGKRGGVSPILMFVKAPLYRTRFKFYEVGTRAAANIFPVALRDAIDYAIRTAK